MSHDPILITDDPVDRPLPYEDGFTVRSMIGAVFVALVMMPGTIYLGLVAGAGLGPAAQWVTIILFTEIARRSMTTLKRQEVYILYYMAAVLAAGGANVFATGGPFGALIFNQYFAQSQQAVGFGIADQIPSWICPSRHSAAMAGRDLLAREWHVPILLTTFLWIMNRVSGLTIGYGLFRLTADVERLQFPLAPIAASGATALAETTSKKETWRWNVFSVGGAAGLAFGAIYIGIPGFTGVLLSKPLQVIPIPFLDLTQTTEHVMPAALAGISIDLGAFITGMVLPFPMVAGSFFASVITGLIANPIMYHYGFFPSWKPGYSLIPTKLAVDFDFWMSVGIGASLCVALIGIYNVGNAFWGTRRSTSGGTSRSLLEPPPGRGDIPIYWCLVAYAVSSVVLIVLCRILLRQDQFPWLMVLAYALFITPLISYVSARMIGLTGAPVAFPFLREGSIILSGYKGVDIWYAPLPLMDYGLGGVQMFRELTLTRTKFISLVKMEVFMLPLALVCGLAFWAFFWHIEAIPSSTYPFTAKMWPLQATYQALFMTATSGSADNFLAKAIKFPLVAGGTGLGFLLLALTSVLRLPHLFFYGVIGGIGQMPNVAIPMFLGAVVGRKYFAPKYGEETWQRYTPVLAAGYACGVGLIGMLSVAFAMIAKTISALPF